MIEKSQIFIMQVIFVCLFHLLKLRPYGTMLIIIIIIIIIILIKTTNAALCI